MRKWSRVALVATLVALAFSDASTYEKQLGILVIGAVVGFFLLAVED